MEKNNSKYTYFTAFTYKDNNIIRFGNCYFDLENEISDSNDIQMLENSIIDYLQEKLKGLERETVVIINYKLMNRK